MLALPKAAHTPVSSSDSGLLAFLPAQCTNKVVALQKKPRPFSLVFVSPAAELATHAPPSLDELQCSRDDTLASSAQKKAFAFGGSKLDKHGRLSSPRAARELALLMLYTGYVSGQKPLWVFRERLNQTSGGDFSIDLLANYNHIPDDLDPIYVEDFESKDDLEQQQQKDSLLEAAVLTAPLPLVYSKFVLRMAQDIIQVTASNWSQQDVILEDLLPIRWKVPGGAVVQQCILHMAMAEMLHLGTSSKIVINEAVELAKRFSDGRSARTINGCLGKFVRSEYYEEKERKKKTEVEIEEGDAS